MDSGTRTALPVRLFAVLITVTLAAFAAALAAVVRR